MDKCMMFSHVLMVVYLPAHLVVSIGIAEPEWGWRGYNPQIFCCILRSLRLWKTDSSYLLVLSNNV